MSLADFKPLPDYASISSYNSDNKTLLPKNSSSSGSTSGASSSTPMFDFNGYANTALSSSIQGGDVTGALKNKFIGDVGNMLDNMGPVGQVLHVGMNLFMNRKGAAEQAKQQTIQHGKMSQQAIQNQRTVCDANISAIIQSFQDGTIQNLDEAKNKITDAINNINDKEAIKEQLAQEQEQIQQEQEGLATKIQERQITINKKEKDGQTEIEFLDKDGQPVNPGEDSELADLLQQYQNNNTRLNTISIEIAALNGEEYTLAQTAQETKIQHEEKQIEAQEEINTTTEETLKGLRQDIQQINSDFSPLFKNDENMHKMYATVDKGLSVAQTAAALTDPINRGKHLQNAAENIIASTTDTLGAQFGINGAGQLATGKVKLEDYATQQVLDYTRNTMNDMLAMTGLDPQITSAITDRLTGDIEPKQA